MLICSLGDTVSAHSHIEAAALEPHGTPGDCSVSSLQLVAAQKNIWAVPFVNLWNFECTSLADWASLESPNPQCHTVAVAFKEETGPSHRGVVAPAYLLLMYSY
jgi:hypothetical protein